MRSTLHHLSIGVLLGAAALSTPALGASAVPVPTVTGPIASTTPGDSGHDYPFYASLVDLKSRGYIEEECFFGGTANR